MDLDTIVPDVMVFSQDQAVEYIEFLNNMNEGSGFAGHNDWRLPTVNEIVTTTDWERIPCIQEQFSPTFTWLYRTKTQDPLDNDRHFFT